MTTHVYVAGYESDLEYPEKIASFSFSTHARDYARGVLAPMYSERVFIFTVEDPQPSGFNGNLWGIRGIKQER